MERKFDHQLGDLKQDLLKMGGEVEESIALAMQALLERDDALIEQVISGGGASMTGKLELRRLA